MPTTYLEIIDTGVKIGLGALISGVSTYFITTSKNKHEITKELNRRELNTIENSSSQINMYFSSLNNFFSAIDGVFRTTINRDEISTEEMSFIRTYDKKLVGSRENVDIAISALHLIELEGPLEALEELFEVEFDARDKVIFGKKLPQDQEIQEWFEKSRDVKKRFFRELAKRYKSKQ